MKKVLTSEVEGKRLRGRPRKTWMEAINNELRSLNANRVDSQSRTLWRKIVRGQGQADFGDLKSHWYGHISKVC